MVKIIRDYPAVFIPGLKVLVIADLHLGLEHELFKSGIVIPPQAEKFQKIIERLVDLTGAKILVILGDVKHEVPGVSYREEKEIPRLFSKITEKIKVFCVKGNHDSFLEKLLPDVKIYSSRGFRIKKYGFFHGHAWPSKELMKCDHLFMGHVHPMVEFKDNFGYRIFEQVFVKGKLKKGLVKKKYKIKRTGGLKTIILPSFNKLLGGIALNSKLEEELIGPLLTSNFFDLKEAEVFLLDGTNLGKIKKLRKG